MPLGHMSFLFSVWAEDSNQSGPGQSILEMMEFGGLCERCIPEPDEIDFDRWRDFHACVASDGLGLLADTSLFLTLGFI